MLSNEHWRVARQKLFSKHLYTTSVARDTKPEVCWLYFCHLWLSIFNLSFALEVTLATPKHFHTLHNMMNLMMVETSFYFPMLSVSGHSGTGTGCDVRTLLQGSKGSQELPAVPRSFLLCHSHALLPYWLLFSFARSAVWLLEPTGSMQHCGMEGPYIQM